MHALEPQTLIPRQNRIAKIEVLIYCDTTVTRVQNIIYRGSVGFTLHYTKNVIDLVDSLGLVKHIEGKRASQECTGKSSIEDNFSLLPRKR